VPGPADGGHPLVEPPCLLERLVVERWLGLALEGLARLAEEPLEVRDGDVADALVVEGVRRRERVGGDGLGRSESR
jgi:hypothetical protein